MFQTSFHWWLVFVAGVPTMLFPESSCSAEGYTCAGVVCIVYNILHGAVEKLQLVYKARLGTGAGSCTMSHPY